MLEGGLFPLTIEHIAWDRSLALAPPMPMTTTGKSGFLLGFGPLPGPSWEGSSQVGRAQFLPTEYVPTFTSYVFSLCNDQDMFFH